MKDDWKQYTIVPEHEIGFLRGVLAMAPSGAVAVCGSFRGGDVMALIQVAPARHFVVVDSFQGMADPDHQIDGTRHPRGDFDAGGLDGYLRNFDEAGSRRPDECHAIYIDEAKLRTIPERPYAMVWLDLDHFRPTLDCVRHFHPLLAPGGTLLTHDFGSGNCPGIARAATNSGHSWEHVQGSLIAFTRKD